MPKSNNPDKVAAAVKASARNTDSSPASLKPGASDDPAVLKAVHTNELAQAMPFNAGKPSEYGFQNGLEPQAGATVQPSSRLPGGSTLSEENGTGIMATGFMRRSTLQVPCLHFRPSSVAQLRPTPAPGCYRFDHSARAQSGK